MANKQRTLKGANTIPQKARIKRVKRRQSQSPRMRIMNRQKVLWRKMILFYQR